MASIFTRIIAGEIPGRLVWADDTCVVMVDIRPLHEGHCLVIPRAEVDHWIDLAPEEGSHLMEVAGHVGRAQHEAFVCGRIGMLIAGFEVPHTHVHVVPIDDMGDLDFRNADPSVDAAELDRVADRLRQQLSDHGHGEAVGRATA
ncbi:MAG: HIT family protein [Actinomycetia bacterium]|nr:HIT family protein [Actinomycetes bacterium]